MHDAKKDDRAKMGRHDTLPEEHGMTGLT